MTISRGCILTIGPIIGLALLVSLPAGAASAQDKWKGTVVKEGDVTVVRNPKEPLYKTPVLELKEDLSLGGPEAQGDYAFGKVRNFVVDDDGAIYVLDTQNAHIKVFDASGKCVRTIGRKGQGPGEQEGPRMVCISRARGEIFVLAYSRRSRSSNWTGPSSAMSPSKTYGPSTARSIPGAISMSPRGWSIPRIRATR